MSKDITIVAVDTYAHELTKLAIEKTLTVLDCKEVLVLSDRNIYPSGRWVEINPINIEDYNSIMIKHLWPFIRTEHILVVQYDGMAVNENYWSDDFLKYDYIGAVWPWPHHPPGYKVGNGGFSLRSKKLLHMLKDKTIVQSIQLPMYEDLYIGVHYKNLLVSRGANIADEKVACKFSNEHPPGYKHTFGFHGTFNVPYYLNDDQAENFIERNPSWTSEGSALLAIHCCLSNKQQLAELAFKLGRKNNTDFDQLVVRTISGIPEIRAHANFEIVLEVIKK